MSSCNSECIDRGGKTPTLCIEVFIFQLRERHVCNLTVLPSAEINTFGKNLAEWLFLVWQRGNRLSDCYYPDANYWNQPA